MGFLDKWSKKKEAEQLKAADKRGEVKVEESAVKKEEKKADLKKTKTVNKGSKKAGSAMSVLIRPVISEKAAVAESQGVYTFAVNNKATKVDIKNAIKDIYDVMPMKIRVVNVEGKDVRFGRNYGKRVDWKKAIITLPKGRSINIHEGV